MVLPLELLHVDILWNGSEEGGGGLKNKVYKIYLCLTKYKVQKNVQEVLTNP